MATTKKRINISVSPEMEIALERLSARENIPQATVAVHLIKIALEVDEDDVWNKIAERRDTSKAKFLSHKKAWA